ncbi:MAG: hypothetical protein E7588_10015 [Ruminococcaceae bacterium]|nr:hypothetical protein [Oscillospiraceae bacterium]
MKAVIMAGGKGERLRPLTCDIPKPMVPVMNQPALHRIIRLLARQGVTQAAVTTMYLAEEIEKTGRFFEGVELNYLRESTPLGTAGSVKRAARDFDEDFIVISGDCICDFDLSDAIAFHRKKNAGCTVILTHRTVPLEYGMALCREDGGITRFIEKPDWSQVFSGCVNTGIYIISPAVLSLIPDGVPFDFAKDLFPLITGKSLYGFEAEGYWCDIGSIKDYYRCCFDAAQGKVNGIQDIRTDDGCIIGTSCVIHGTVRDSILHNDVTVGKNSNLEGCIVCRGAKLGDNVTVQSGAVIGAGCVIGDNCTIKKGVKIYADIKIPEGSIVMKDIIHGGENTAVFSENGISGSIKDTLSPERCFALGAACVIKEGDRVGVMAEENGGAVSALVKNCLMGGICHAGGTALDFGEGSRTLSCHAAMCYRQDIMLYVETGADSVQIYTAGRDSLSLTGETERSIKKNFESGVKYGKNTCKPIVISGLRELYITNLIRGKANMKGLSCGVSDTPAGGLLAEALNILGAQVQLYSESAMQNGKNRHKLLFEITDNDLKLYADGYLKADFEHIRAYLVYHKTPEYHNIAIPYTSPAILDEIIHNRGGRVYRYLSTPTGSPDLAARSLAADIPQLIFRDMCFAAMQICQVLSEMEFDLKKLSEAFKALPPFSRNMRDIEYEEEKKAAVMKRITNDPSPDTEGAQLIFRGGRALIIPKRTGGFRIIAEAVSTEAAREISFEAERRLYNSDDEQL